MKSALELRKSKQEKLEKRQKENTERINLEMLEIEKAFNKWESDLNDSNNYITIPLIIKTNEVKSLLDEKGYIIDKVSNDIKVNTTRIYLDKNSYNTAISYENHRARMPRYHSLTDPFGVKETEEKEKSDPMIVGDSKTIELVDLLKKLETLSKCGRL